MQRMKSNRVKIFIICLLYLFTGGVMTVTGAGISGELYYQTVGNGLSPTSLEQVWVKAYLEDPANPGACNSKQDDRWYIAQNSGYWCSWCSPEKEISEYYLWNLPDGTYYVRTAENWWDGEQDCNNATPITVSGWDYVYGKNFIINPGATISGTIYEESSTTPPTTTPWFEVVPYKISNNDPCEFEPGWPLTHAITSTPDNTFTLAGLPTGNYILQAHDNNFTAGGSGYFLSEFYTSSATDAADCSNAEIIFVTTPNDSLIEKDFFLHEGGVISGTIYQQGRVVPVTTSTIISSTIYQMEEETTPVTTDMVVTVYSAVTNQIVKVTEPASSYTTLLEPGDYYVYITKTAGDAPFAWWATPNTVKNFSAAQKITVTIGNTESGKDFWLDSFQSTPSLAPIYMLLLNKQPPVTE